MKILLLLHLFVSSSFGQTPEIGGKSILEKQLLLLQHRDLLEDRITDQRTVVDSLNRKNEEGIMSAEQLLAAREEIKRMKELMLAYQYQIDSLDEVNRMLLQSIEPYPLNAKALHIDFVQFLPESGEYALSLSFLPETNQKDWYDSVQFHFEHPKFGDNPDYYRYDTPEVLVQRFFHTDRLQEVKLYAENNQFIGDGIFQGYEYISQNIDPKMVAVFLTASPSSDTAFYAIGGLEDTLSDYPLSYCAFTETFHKVHTMAIPKDYQDHHQFELRSAKDFHFMVVQAYKDSIDAEGIYGVNVLAKLYLENEGEILPVHQLNDGWLYWHLHPLALNHKGYPIILLEKAMMDSDWFMQVILIWNGEAYEEWSVRFDVGE